MKEDEIKAKAAKATKAMMARFGAPEFEAELAASIAPDNAGMTHAEFVQKAKAKQMGIPQSVGKEFAQADKGMKFDKAPTKSRADLQKVNKPETRHGGTQLFKEGGRIMATKKMSKGGDTTMSNPSRERKGLTMEKMGGVKAGGKRAHGEHSVQEKGHTKGKQPTMAGGKVQNRRQPE